MLPATVAGTSSTSDGAPNVRAYAAQQGSGYALFLFNLDETAPALVSVTISHAKRGRFTATETYYDKSIYDQSQNNVWAPSIVRKAGTPSSVRPRTEPDVVSAVGSMACFLRRRVRTPTLAWRPGRATSRQRLLGRLGRNPYSLRCKQPRIPA